jgi:hypothetical protein
MLVGYLGQRPQPRPGPTGQHDASEIHTCLPINVRTKRILRPGCPAVNRNWSWL